MRIVPSGWEKEFAPRQPAPARPPASKLFSDVLHNAANQLSKTAPASRNGTGTIARPNGSGGRQVSDVNVAERQIFDGGQPSTAVESAAPAAVSGDLASAPFVPKFIENVTVTSIFGGTWPLNPDYFATPETAQWIASKYGTGEVVDKTIYGFGNPYQPTTTTQAHIKLANGTLVNAGLLACYYRTYPESKFPGLADIMVRQAVASAS